MTAFDWIGTDGNWNVDGNWDNSGWPDGADDTASITGDHVVTIPVSTSINCGAITIGGTGARAENNFR